MGPNWELSLERTDISEPEWLVYSDWQEEFGDIDIANGIRILSNTKKQPYKEAMSIELESLLQEKAITEDIKFEISWEWLFSENESTTYFSQLPKNVGSLVEEMCKDNNDVYINKDLDITQLEFLSRFKAINVAAKAYGIVGT
jgi:hypothetical protein